MRRRTGADIGVWGRCRGEARRLGLGIVIDAVIARADLRGVIGFSSFGVLIYYLVANIAAFTQPEADRRYINEL